MRVFAPSLAALLAALVSLAACGESAPAAPDLAREAASPAPVPSAAPTSIPTAPGATRTPEPSPTAVPALATAAPAPPDRDLAELAQRLRGVSPSDASTAARDAVPLRAGDRRDFWLTRSSDGSGRRASATLLAVSENAYWFAEDGVGVEKAALEAAAEIFESRVRPAVVGAFGDIRKPGLDGDPRLFILHAALFDGVVGYFGSKDAFPAAVHPRSNEREIVYMSADALGFGQDAYMSVLTHELQHAIHFARDTGEESWVNEGLSEVAVAVAGYPNQFAPAFEERPDTQLNYWGNEPVASGRYYGAAGAFFNYAAQRVGGFDNLAALAGEPLDGVDGVDNFLRAHGFAFEDVFADWTIANYLDADDDQRYGYLNRETGARASTGPAPGAVSRRSLPQFSARYYVWDPPVAGGMIRFAGDTTVRQVGEDCAVGASCWWSGRGDSIDSKLTREFDLSGLSEATLEFAIRRDIEEGWDYGYVQASADGGRTWRILSGLHTTDANPSGNAYGDGYTGSGGWEGGWERETIDLTPLAGAPVLVRFEYITDDAVYLDGMLIDDISIPQLGFRDEPETPQAWRAEGFSLVGAPLAQEFIVQLIEIDNAGGDFTVTRLELDDRNRAETRYSPDAAVVVLVVSPTTRGTIHPAGYSVELADGGG